MIGRRILINDYKFAYEKAAGYLNVYAAFMLSKKQCYIIYSYDNKKIYYGNLYVKNRIGTIMITQEADDIIKEFIDNLVNNKVNNNYQVIDLNYIDSIQIIDEKLCDFSVDINKVYNITMPKEVDKRTIDNKKNKSIIPVIIVLFLFAGIGIYLYINKNSLIGDNEYICEKTYKHEELPADVNEEINISFVNGNLSKVKVILEHVFTDTNYYKEFKDSNMFYKYMEKGYTYKFDDDAYIYRTFNEINIDKNFSLPKKENKLISYYISNDYKCNLKEE